MQGLVQAMQTQAHTQAVLQAQLEAQASLLHTRFEDGAIDVAWDEFVRLFRAKFVPEHVQDRMEQEFLSLAQGSMTVLEYKARFSELSKYAPHIMADERRKTKKFVMGLKPSLRTRLVAFDHCTLDEALSAACRQEGEMEQYLEEKKASQKRPTATFQRQDKKKACGSSDHKIKDCPRLQQGVQCGVPAPAAVAAEAPATGRPGRPRALARVFTLAREDAEQAEHVTEVMRASSSSSDSDSSELDFT
ncbi:hypothetical protein Taro_016724 [Colocasia esculenta]|uniref:Retrotransposon gag domain-containing protein n=1 Tax=Colocasia esculenta TaxID=4460 RepID=A0A843UL51_COLES|nr:hypothetical protein [Colocasia esculenta]